MQGYNFPISIYLKNIFSKGLTIPFFILVRNIYIYIYIYIEVLMIWVSAGRMSSRHSIRSEVGMGSKAQLVSMELYIIVINCVTVTG